jgi:molybdopterin/thiamine biosynthesis adenylyltransferase
MRAPDVGELRILANQYDRFATAMLADAPLETVATCRVGWWRSHDGHIHLVWQSAAIAEPTDYERRGPAGAVVSPAFVGRATKQAREDGFGVLIAHTHPFSSIPQFSGIDDGGEDVLVPKIAARAPTAPHGGLVLGQAGGSIRVWMPGTRLPTPIRLRVIGPKGPAGRRSGPEYDRQDLALGPGTAAALATKHVAIVGAGGLGWEAASLLWAHGIGRLTPIDDDILEAHNRPRLRGSRADQIGLPKVDALAEILRGTRSDGWVEPITSRFEAAHAREVVASADLLVVATDNLASRLDADRFGRRLLVPIVDGGINIQVEDGHLRRVGGRVNVSLPTDPCLSCMGVLSPDALARETDPLGYRGRGRTEEASVAAFNATVASLMVIEALALLLPLRAHDPRSKYLTYDGLRGVVREVAIPASPVCGVCHSLTGDVHGTLP